MLCCNFILFVLENCLNDFLIQGEPEQINGYKIYLDLSTSIPYVSLLDVGIIRSVVIDMQYLEPKLINDMPMLFDTNTGRAYLQNESVAKTSPMAYELVIFLSLLNINFLIENGSL